MKRFDASTLIPGASWYAQAEDEAEVVRKSIERLKSEHGETQVRPEMVERIKQRIVTLDSRDPVTDRSDQHVL